MSLLALFLLGLAVVYYLLDPVKYSIFPKCPFFYLTGYKCPGCGTQQAVHHLLHLDLAGAIECNFLFILAIPYIVAGFLFDYTSLSRRFPRAKRVLFGKEAIILASITVIAYWILRNL